MLPESWWYALAGGALIGVASALLMLIHGRIAGISGVLGALVPPVETDAGWRVAFVLGLLGAGAVGAVVAPDAIGSAVRSTWLVIVAGLVVGVGTQLGSGCTSGHGVCGLARGSGRSLVAVMVFMATGAITATALGALS